MTFPYKVTVKKKGKNDIHIKVDPQPVTTKQEYATIVSGKIQNLLLDESYVKDSLFGRVRLKQALIAILKDYHEQGIIKPKEKDEEPL